MDASSAPLKPASSSAGRPELSIIIPTRNRHPMAVEAIQSCLQLAGDLEVVVQDCSDGRELEVSLRERVDDPRVQYSHSGGPLSMTENWNRAIERATGEYVIVIGDDDGVTRDLLDAVRWARAHEIESLSFAPFRYFWPDFPGRFAGELLAYRTTGYLRAYDVQSETKRASRASGQVLKHLPKVYHGLLHRAAIEHLREQTGTVFDTMNPDCYVRYALTSCVGTHWRLDHPLTTLGSSGPSNSGRRMRGVIDQHLDEYRELDWPSVLPPMSESNIQVTLTQSMLRAFERTERHDLARNVNVAAVFASCMHKQPTHFKALFRRFVSSVRMLGRSLPPEIASLALQMFRQYTAVLRVHTTHANLPFGMTGPDIPTRKLVDVHPASGLLEANRERDAHLARQGIEISQVLADADQTFEKLRCAVAN